MRNDPFFIELVGLVLKGEPLGEVDLDHTPVVQKNPDGSVTNLMEQELGTDPRRYLCPRCDRETENPGKQCDACANFMSKGD
jgi:hypothetical protein